MAQELRRQHSRARRLGPSGPAAMDDESRERRRLVEVELRLPPEPRTARVEPALVAEDPAAHVLDPVRSDLACELVDLGGGQRRISVALEHEVPLPGRSALLPL